MERAVNTTIEEEAFSMWSAYTHYWATDVFSMDPHRNYKSGIEPNHKGVKTEREWSESTAVKEEGFG
jgi:hypothetical protein